MYFENFSDEAKDHFFHPRNAGKIDDADGEGHCGNPDCGDYLVIYIKVRNSIIIDSCFLVYGCAAAIATSSMTTELAKGKSLEEAFKISDQDVLNALGGLPEKKIHCSLLGPTALKDAISNYHARIEDYKKSLVYYD